MSLRQIHMHVEERKKLKTDWRTEIRPVIRARLSAIATDLSAPGWTPFSVPRRQPSRGWRKTTPVALSAAARLGDTRLISMVEQRVVQTCIYREFCIDKRRIPTCEQPFAWDVDDVVEDVKPRRAYMSVEPLTAASANRRWSTHNDGRWPFTVQAAVAVDWLTSDAVRYEPLLYRLTSGLLVRSRHWPTYFFVNNDDDRLRTSATEILRTRLPQTGTERYRRHVAGDSTGRTARWGWPRGQRFRQRAPAGCCGPLTAGSRKACPSLQGPPSGCPAAAVMLGSAACVNGRTVNVYTAGGLWRIKLNCVSEMRFD